MDEKVISKEDLWESAKKMARASHKKTRDIYDTLCYMLGPKYWTYEYGNYPNEIGCQGRSAR